MKLGLIAASGGQSKEGVTTHRSVQSGGSRKPLANGQGM